MGLTPHKHAPDDPALADILHLVQTAFAEMSDRIDPPSSMYRLTLESVTEQTRTGEIWSLGAPIRACVFLTPKPDSLYIGKLSVAPDARRLGLARRLINLADARAKHLEKPKLVLETRVELSENHQLFETLGFKETGRKAHPGYDRPTSITYCRAVA